MTTPTPADADIAAETFDEDLTTFFSDTRRRRGGWGLVRIDPLNAVAVIPAGRPEDLQTPYFVHMNAAWYDAYPPQLRFVEPAQGWPTARWGSSAFPAIAGSPRPNGSLPGQCTIQFALHDEYPYPDGSRRQLVCFSHSFDYYISSHGPSDDQRWTQGVHRVAASLSRLHLVLQPPNYLGRSSDLPA